MLTWPSQRREARALAQRILSAVIAASRRPALFGAGRVADTLEGRFEVLTLHAALALVRMRAAPEAKAASQVFVDLLFRHIDAGLREAGVGDLTVPKRMHALAGSFYGRVEAYAAALAARDPAALAQAIARNVLNGQEGPFALTLADETVAAAGRQAEQPYTALAEPWAAVFG